MARRTVVLSLALRILLLVFSDEAHAEMWTTAYYAGWMQPYLPASEVDFTAVTHVIHFAIIPRADGTLDASTLQITPGSSADVVTRAHDAGVPVLISVGGAGTAGGFRGATSAANLSRFVANLVAFMSGRGYDGIDVDWEPLESADRTQFTALARSLRSALDSRSPRPLLTAAVGSEPALIASVQDSFDQVNLMTYVLSGPWPGWVTWHNSPIYDGGYRFPSTGGLVPSADGMVQSFVDAGVAPGKLGIGIDFYGFVWGGGGGTATGGVTAPRQSWTATPWISGETAYYTIRSDYFREPWVRSWDPAAEAAYLSLDSSGSSGDRFVSFDDETTCARKVAYARNRGIGGVMIWELGGGYRADQAAGERDPLLQAVKRARRTVTPTPGRTATAPPPPTPKPTSTPTAKPTSTPTARPSSTATVRRTSTPTARPTSTPTTRPPSTPTARPTSTPTTRPPSMPSATRTPARTSTPARTPTGTPVPDAWIYRDSLVAPWADWSWSATTSFSATAPVFAGSRSTRVVQQAWGALSLHRGDYGAAAIDPRRYASVRFVVNGGDAGIHLAVLLEDDAGSFFPEVDLGDVPPNVWTQVTVPMSRLDPAAGRFSRIDVRHLGSSGQTFWIDELRLVGK
ncbi:MAG: chitinase [Candidatus Binatota bacterium]|nr:chitinase [Candidatus Binatota bacterium]